MRRLSPTMRRNVLFLVGALVFFLIPAFIFRTFFPEQSQAAWYNSSWGYRKAMTIGNTKVSGSSNLSNFPVLVSITDPDVLAHAQADGDDIMFTSSDGTTKLDHEIESYNSTTGVLVAWVEVPTLSVTANTILYLYYGNSGASNQQNITAVWDSNFKGVWHLAENPAGSAPQMQDSTSNNFDGTSNGTMTSGDQVAGKVNGSLDFDGSNDYIGAGNQSALNASSAFTVSGWINRTADSAGSASTIAGKYGGTAGWFFEVTDSTDGGPNQVRWFLSGVSDTSLYGIVNLSMGSWDHVVGVYDGANKLIYVNGQLTASEVTTGTPGTTTDPFQIGYDTGTGGANNYTNGKIDEVRVSNIVRSADWIATEYNNQSSPLTFFSVSTVQTQNNESGIGAASNGGTPTVDAGLVGHWKFDENIGTRATDATSNSNTGTLTNGPTWVPGKYGSALTFDGTNDYILLPSRSVNETTFSMSAWIKTTSTADSKIFSMSANDHLLATINGHIRTCINGGCTEGTTNIADGNWHYASVTGSGSTIVMYVDDKVEFTTTASTTTVSAVPYLATVFGAGGGFFTGQLDDLRLYNYARTPGEIVKDMNAGHPLGGSPISSEIAYWGLDEQQGQTANSRGFGSGMGGTFGANTSASTDDPTWKTGTDCKVNGCLSFDGGDYVKTANDALNGLSSQGSYSLWFKTNATSEALLVSNEGYHGIYINFNSVAGKVTAFFDGSSGSHASTAQAYNDNVWHHVVATNNGTTTKVYIDGTEVLSFAETFAAPSSTQPFVIGAQYTGATSRFTGTIDEVKAYTAALTPSEVLIDMNAGSALNAGTGAAIEATQLSDGAGNPPVGYWNLDENTGSTTNDISGNSNTGTITNAVWAPGKVGGALFFDGTGDLVTVGSGSTLNTQTFTISAWVKSSSTTNARTIIGQTSGNGYQLRLESSTNKIQLLKQGAVNIFTAPDGTNLTNNVWTHVSVSYTAAGAYAAYINGRLVTSGTNDQTLSFSTVVLGQGNASGEHFNGYLDDVKFYDYARTPAQVAYDYNRGGPAGWWKLDECTGATAYDSSGNGYNGTITPGGSGNTATGTCGSGVTTQMWDDGTIGKFNGSLGFDGTNDTVLGTDFLDFEYNQPMSVAAWIKTTTNSGMTIVSKQASSAPFSGWNLQTGGSGYIYFQLVNTYCTTGNCVEVNFPQNSNYYDGNWHHLVATYDGSGSGAGVKLYMDGKQLGSLSGTGTSITTSSVNAVPVHIGSRNGAAQFFNGQIDDVRVYTYALSTSQVLQIMNNAASLRFGPTTGSP
ncbi:MAG: DUF2341 domain-containing protein [bacterium]|nr:DUF2341 domain-containing protein [bacterium]